eukprot:TRINITY_DN37781_c0_g1_i1.p1 TRINITY_DN37781_c0_g1~~TRINITY_DN37781_c0_g1_i1.p1  ORF type:complete len:330 (-),score=39.25 TRINITY_DN37781_c0_g1_i1:72-1061(-)
MLRRESDDPLEWEDKPDDEPLWRHAIAGSSAGIAEHVGTYPFDTIKTRMQACGQPTGVRGIVNSIVAENGWRGFFRGASAIGVGCVPAHCGLFLTYELGKTQAVNDADDANTLGVAVCGASAATVHDVILTPTDVVKQRLQLGRYNGPFDCLRTVVRTEGLHALYRSLPVTLLSNAPNTAILAAVNESMKSSLGLSRGARYQDLPLFFLSAGVGGAVAAAATLPLDVLKTRLQTQCVKDNGSGTLGIIRSIWHKEGIRGFYKGFTPRLAIATPAATMCWGTYESVHFLLRHSLDDEKDGFSAAGIAFSKLASSVKRGIFSEGTFSLAHA